MKKQSIWVFEWRKSVHYWWSYILFSPECKELTSMLDPLLYRWGVPPVVIRCVHWTMQSGVPQTCIKALGLANVMTWTIVDSSFILPYSVSWQQWIKCAGELNHHSTHWLLGDMAVISICTFFWHIVTMDILSNCHWIPLNQHWSKFWIDALRQQSITWTCDEPINPIHKSQNATVPYPTMLHSEQKCAHFCSEWSIAGYGTGTFWDLWNQSISIVRCGVIRSWVIS